MNNKQIFRSALGTVSQNLTHLKHYPNVSHYIFILISADYPITTHQHYISINYIGLGVDESLFYY